MKAASNSLIPLKRAHIFGSPMRCNLYESYSARLGCGQSLKILIRSIKSGISRPFFQRREIDRIFQEEVLRVYANGRYLDIELATLDHWEDLLNNLATLPVINCTFLKDPDFEAEERAEIIAAFKKGLRQLKIIEDWIHYHPEEQEKISQLLLDRQISPQNT